MMLLDLYPRNPKRFLSPPSSISYEDENVEKDGGRIAINPDKFDKLITALRTAVDIDGTLDKESTSLKFYHFKERID